MFLGQRQAAHIWRNMFGFLKMMISLKIHWFQRSLKNVYLRLATWNKMEMESSWCSSFLQDNATYLVLLSFTLLYVADSARFCFVLFCFLTNWRFVATLHQANLSVPFFPTTCAHFMSMCHILVILTVFQTFTIISVLVICDQWPLMLLL